MRLRARWAAHRRSDLRSDAVNPEPDERAVREALEEAGWWTYQPDRDPSADRWGLGFFRGVGWGLVFALVLWAGAVAGGVLLGWLAWQAVR